MILKMLPIVETTTKAMEMQEITLAAMEVWGFSIKSHKQIWYLTNFPVPKSSSTSFFILLASFFISSITCSFLVLYLF